MYTIKGIDKKNFRLSTCESHYKVNMQSRERPLESYARISVLFHFFYSVTSFTIYLCILHIIHEHPNTSYPSTRQRHTELYPSTVTITGFFLRNSYIAIFLILDIEHKYHNIICLQQVPEAKIYLQQLMYDVKINEIDPSIG